MNRDRIIARTLVKIGFDETKQISEIVENLEKIYLRHKRTDYNDPRFPKDIVRFMQDILKESDLEQKGKLKLFNELKNKKFFDWTLNKELEKAWRLIFRRWNLPNLNFSN
jgi:hypothetical protein